MEGISQCCKITRNKNFKKLHQNSPSIDKKKKEDAKHNVSNVAIDVVECRQKWQSIGTQEVIIAYVFISSVVQNLEWYKFSR